MGQWREWYPRAADQRNVRDQQITNGLGGQYEVMSVNADAAVLPPIKTDKLRARVAGTPAHLGVLPLVPTLKELSFESANRMSVFGVYAPVGVPATMLDRQHAEVNKALATPALREPLTASDNVPASTSRAEFNQQIAADFHINSRRIKAAFIKAHQRLGRVAEGVGCSDPVCPAAWDKTIDLMWFTNVAQGFCPAHGRTVCPTGWSARLGARLSCARRRATA